MIGTRIDSRVRVWAAAADPQAIWLVSHNDQGQPDAWLSDPLVRRPGIPVREVAHRTTKGLLRAHGELDACRLLHSTSWVEQDDCIVLDYIAVLGGFGYVDSVTGNIGRGAFEYVRDVWPHARPFTFQVSSALDKAPAHAATALPDPRYFDLFRHAIGHLEQQRHRNSNTRDALDEHWHRHLAEWQETLAGQYVYDLTA